MPVVARTHGLAAALPLLNEIKAKATPTLDIERNYSIFDPDYAYGTAVTDLMPLVGAGSPARALKLAQSVQNDEQRARALVRAAAFQTPAVAAPLYREAAAKIYFENAPRLAAQVWARDPKLGLELFAIVRGRLEKQMENGGYSFYSWLPFAFYLAPADPATARLILEREAAQKSGNGESAYIAMTRIDARRAVELARQARPDDRDFQAQALRNIARFLIADDATRQKLTFNGFNSLGYASFTGDREAWPASEEDGF